MSAIDPKGTLASNLPPIFSALRSSTLGAGLTLVRMCVL